MSKKNAHVLIGFALFAMLLSACNLNRAPTPGDQNLAATAAVQTVSAIMTQSAFETIVAELTQIAQATATPLPPTATEVPPTPTATQVPPTSTPAPPTPTATVIPCNWAQFVRDVTIADNSKFGPGERFTKTWRLKNIGRCTWTEDYELVFASGSSMNGPSSVKFDATVRPGETIDLSARLTSPDKKGTYTGNWKLRSDKGVDFGIGGNANSVFWVKIVVDDDAATPGDNPLNFAYSYCDASWRSGKGSLSCPTGKEDFTNGSINRTSRPKFEGGYEDNEPTLIMIPSDGDDGYISGRFPAMKVKNGDTFTAIIGCIYDSPKCNVKFRLNYRLDNETKNLASWNETYDDKWQRISVDLSSLADKTVEFSLEVQNRDDSSKDNRAFWLMPSIQR